MAQQQAQPVLQTDSGVTPTPTPTPKPDQIPGEAARLVCDYFGGKPDSTSDVTERNGGLKKSKREGSQSFDAKNFTSDYCRVKSIPNLKIRSLIATLPDPKDSRLDHSFDRYLNAIQRAIDTAGYIFDRYWLPWDKSKIVAPVISSANPQLMQTATRYLQEPGVILYRGKKEKELLLLFLVGETPTGGIHRVAFKNALTQVEQLSGWARSKTNPSGSENALLILGPTFSGSYISLAILLHDWMGEHGPPEVKIITGSATAIDQCDLLKRIDKPGVSFKATVIGTSESRGRLYEYLTKLDDQYELKEKSSSGDKPKLRDGIPPIAIISESGTVYGQQTREQPRQKPHSSKRGKAQPDINCPSSPSSPELPVISFTFPVHLSQLRVEAAKNATARKEVIAAPGASDPNLSLPMREAGSPNSKDSVPLFSPLETVTMELSLREMLATVHRERVRYVALSATDVQDRIFLVREIRKHCPNVTIFIRDNDLLYLHYESNFDFQGVQVISSYPLFGLNQLWTYPFAKDHRRLQFSTHSSQGVYNATLELLGEQDQMLEYGMPFHIYKKGESRRPALWLGVVGRNGIWPVKAIEIEDTPGGYTLSIPANSDSSQEHPYDHWLGLSGNYGSSTGIGLLLLIGALCLFLPLVFLAQLILSWSRSKEDGSEPDRWREGRSKLSRAVIERILEIEREIKGGNVRTSYLPFTWIRRGWLGRTFGDEEFYCYRMGRRIYLMLCSVSLLTTSLLIFGVTTLLAWTPIRGGAPKSLWNRSLALGVLAGALLLIASVAFLTLMTLLIKWLVRGRRHFRRHVGALLALGVGGVMITFIAWGLYGIFRTDPREEVFFFLRATELSSGVSILLPGLLIGLAAFLSFFTALRRLNLGERMSCLRGPGQRRGEGPQFLRFDHERARSFSGVKALEDQVKEMIVCGAFGVPGVTIVSALIIAVYYVAFFRYFIPTVDGYWFDQFFKLAFCVTPMLLIWALMRFFWLWVATSRLLRRLSWHPLIASYAAGHTEDPRFASLPPVDLTSRAPTYTALSLSVRQARSFCNSLKLPPEQAETEEQVKGLVEVAESKLSLALHADARDDWQEALQNRRDSQAALAELTESVTGLLEDSWRTGGGEGEVWQDEGKFFLITHLVAFLQHVFAHLQNLVGLVTMGLLLILLATISYPFQPRQPLLIFSWVAILFSVVVTLFIFAKLSTDKTLSLLAGTTPGKLSVTRDLVTRMLIHGAVPVIALLGVQFPETVRQIVTWLNGFAGKGN
jgi:hypothetical protein